MKQSFERCQDLLIDRATSDLDDNARRELAVLLDAHPEWDHDAYERTLAAFDVVLQPRETIPVAMIERLRRTARAWSASRR